MLASLLAFRSGLLRRYLLRNTMVMEMNLWAEKERRKGGWFGSSTADRDGSKQFKFLSTARQGQIL